MGCPAADLQAPDGQWGGGTWLPRCWISTSDTLLLLRDLGLDPRNERARRAVGLVRDNCTWGPGFGDSPFFEGEVEPCINGRVLASGAYFGEASDRLLNRLLHEQLEDGGWNCYAPQASDRRSTRRSVFLKDSWSTKRRKAQGLPSGTLAFAGRST